MCQLTQKLSLVLLAVLLTGLSTGCTAKLKRARHLSRGDKYYAASEYPKAEIEYLNVLKVDPQNAHAWSRLGLIYDAEGRVSRAYYYLNKAVELNPGNAETRIKAGQLYLGVGDVKNAREQAEAVLKQSPTNSEAPLLLADAARTESQLDEVRHQLEELRKQIGDSASLELGLATLDLRAGDSKTARARIDRAQTLDPQSAMAWFAQGFLYLTENDLTNAGISFKKAADLSPPRSPQRLQYARFKVRTGAVEEGKRLLTDMTKATPDYLPAWINLAEVAFAEREYTNCQSLVSESLRRDPENYNALLLGARLKLAEGHADQAIAEYERISTIQGYSKSPQVFYQLGLAYLYHKDATRALKNFNQAVALDPNFTEALLQQAALNIQRDNTDAAITSLSQLIQRRPKTPLAYLLLANAYIKKGNPSAALDTCRSLAKLYPKNPQVPLIIGRLRLAQGQKEEAHKAFNLALQLAPDFLPALEQLVALDISDKSYDSALQLIQAQMKEHTNSPPLLALSAQVFMARTNLDQAEKALHEAITIDPNYRLAYLMLANLYVSSKQNAKAIEKLNEEIEKNPRDVTALMLQGMIYNQETNYAAARTAYEKLLAVDPNSWPALNNVAYLYSEKFGMLDKAYEAARKARDLAPNNPFSSDTLGWILYKRGEYNWALGLLQDSANKLADEPEVQYHLGMTYYMLDDESRARDALNRALTLVKQFPQKNFAGQEEAARRLALLSIDIKGASQETLATLEAQIAKQPDDPVALSRLAALYEQQGSPEKAAQAYETALAKNAHNGRLLAKLAELYSEHLNKPDKAMELAKDAYKYSPDDPDVSLLLGRLVFADGQYKWALSLFQQSLQKRPDNPDLLYCLAQAYYSVGKVNDAETTMRNALHSGLGATQANDATNFLNLISLPDDPAKAVSEAEQIRNILQTDPTNVPALMASAAASEKQGNPAAAAESYEQVLKRYPEFLPAIRKLAIFYAQGTNNTQRAYELAVAARSALPDDPGVAQALGTILYRRGDYRGAVPLLNASSRSGAPDGRTLYFLGMAHYQLKDAKSSKQELQRALTLNLPPELANEARRVLAELK